MPVAAPFNLKVEPLGPYHDRTGFTCGIESLHRYFRMQAGQDVKRKTNGVFVLIDPHQTKAGAGCTAARGCDPARLCECKCCRVFYADHRRDERASRRFLRSTWFCTSAGFSSPDIADESNR